MQRNLSLAAVLGTVVLACCANAAQAGNYWTGDKKTISGASCHPSDGKQVGDFAITATGIRNMATTARQVSCPVVLDSESAIDQADTDSATPAGGASLVIALDYSQVAATGSFTTKCVLAEQAWSGAITTEVVSYIAGRGTYINNLAVQPAMLNGFSASSGLFSFNCTLPPKVKLAWFTFYENGATEGQGYSP